MIPAVITSNVVLPIVTVALLVSLALILFISIRALKNLSTEKVRLYLAYSAQISEQAFAAVTGKQPDLKLAKLDGQMQLLGSKETLDASGYAYECMSKVITSRGDGSSKKDVDDLIEELAKAVSYTSTCMQEDLGLTGNLEGKRTDGFARTRLLSFGRSSR